MKKTLILAALLLNAGIAQAQPVTAPKPSLQVITQAPQVSPVMEKVAALQTEWARIKYKVAGDDEKVKAFQLLETEAAAVTQQFAGKAEPLIWQAIILSTEAGIGGGLSALPKVKQAKKLLEASLQIDPKALEGSASTSLGSLYYQVPGWPIGFGDDKKAEKKAAGAEGSKDGGSIFDFGSRSGRGLASGIADNGDVDAPRPKLEGVMSLQ